VEVERALGENWGIVAFYDVGNAFDRLSNINAAQDAGLGVRYYTKVGPMRLDIARQIDVKEPSFRINLTVGLGL
jgi:translocation and assembly module TamA